MRPKRQISATKAWSCTVAQLQLSYTRYTRSTRYTRYTLLETGLDHVGPCWTDQVGPRNLFWNFHKFDLFQIFQIRQMFHVRFDQFDLSIFSMFAAFNVLT